MLNQKHGKIIAGVIAFILAASFVSLGLEQIYVGGWEVKAYAVRAKGVGKDKDGQPWASGWEQTKPSFWKHDFDAPLHGAPDLIVSAGLAPVHVNKDFAPSDKTEPAYDPIVKKTATRTYIYDVHLYKMDITLQVAGDHKTTDDWGYNSIESECSYSHDREGDYGSHDFYVRFQFEIDQWGKFVNETDSWAGIMSIFLWDTTAVGVQEYELPKEMKELDTREQTEIIHNVLGKGDALNMWTEELEPLPNSVEPTQGAGVAPDADIPQKVIFELWAQFRCGALLGRDWANQIEQIFVLNPFAVYHVAFEVMTIHEFYLEAEPTTIPQEEPQPVGVAPTPPPKWGFFDWLKDLGNWLKPDFGQAFAMIVTLLIVFLALVIVIYLILRTGGK